MIDEEEYVTIGKIGRVYRSSGEVVVYAGVDLFSLQHEEPVFILLEGAPVPFYIARDGVRRGNAASYIVKFDFVDSAQQAERLIGRSLVVKKELAGDEEEEDTLSGPANMVGFVVHDALLGECGEVIDAVDYSGNIVLTIQMLSQNILVPLSGNYVKKILPEERVIHVEIPEELKELNA